MHKSNATFYVNQIGTVVRDGDDVLLVLEKSVIPALCCLSEFSHVIVLWWAHQLDGEDERKVLQIQPPYAPNTDTGVFASRAPIRPNPIMTTVCPIEDVDEANGIVKVSNIDAMHGSPILDLKGYFACCDRVERPVVPAWIPDWGPWLPRTGIGLDE
ncbi:SAM-dependent methyltransferase [candidate division KSB1 bacterium]|nr:SAM-dependent methyltransferase [candidate division KSB1 bacterium]